jgi:hypothetical protein
MRRAATSLANAGRRCVAASPEARSPYALLDEVERARDVLVLTYTASLEFFERFALADARALGALVTVVSDATMVRADPVVVRRAGIQYLDGRAVCPQGAAFHPKLFVVAGEEEARVAIGSGNLTVAGWHANAETWTVLRADADGGPDSLRDVSAFLRGLVESPISLSAGTDAALTRVADGLDRLPADQPGPELLDSLTQPIAEQLPPSDEPVDDLVLYAPFHDAALDGVRDLLERLSPSSWTVFVQPDTVVDGPALERLIEERGGHLSWISRRIEQADGGSVSDSRYWHGKLAQWRTSGGQTWAMTGSPNLSAPALLRPVGSGGNCELALIARTDDDLRPTEGEPPAAGLAVLSGPTRDDVRESAPVLLSAIARDAEVRVELTSPLSENGAFERYSAPKDRWTRTASVTAGRDRYRLDIAAAPRGQAIRVHTDSGLTSNEVFVADPKRLARRQQHAIGKVRTDPGDVVRGMLGSQLLYDIEQLRGSLLQAGATVRVPRPKDDDQREDEDGGELPVARPAAGKTLEEFLEACDPVLGQRMTEFALVLPALPGVGVAIEEEVGTLDSDQDEDATEDAEEPEEGGRSIRDELNDAGPDERERYRRFVERLISRSAQYPMLVRTLAVRTLFHSIAAGLWPDEKWPELLAEALRALPAPGDEPNEWEQAAAASLAAVGLALLRTDVPLMSRRDENQMRYEQTAKALVEMLADRDPEKLLLLADELPGRLSGAPGAEAGEAAVVEAISPPRGAERAVRLLAEEHDIDAHVAGAETIIIEDELPGLPEPSMVTALYLADGPGPTFARATTCEGYRVLAAWCAPWFVVEKETKAGKCMVRAWRLPGETLHALIGEPVLPQAEITSWAGAPRPDDVADLLELADEDI